MNSSTQSKLVSDFSAQLNSRFHSNTVALYVLICLVLILILVIEIVKFAKKTYEWQTEFEINLQMKYGADDTNFVMVRESQEVVITDNNKHQLQNKAEKIIPQSVSPIPPSLPQSNRIKKEIFVPAIIKGEQILKTKVLQLAIIAVNIAMLSSYEFVNISAYIVIVLIAISEILGLKEGEHLNLKFILQIIAKCLMIGWYINVLTVAQPNLPKGF